MFINYYVCLNCRGRAVINVVRTCDPKIVSEYDQEIPQSQTADNPMTPRGRDTQPLRDTRKTKQSNQLSLSH